MARRETEFQTIRSEGGLLPADLLQRILDAKERLPGTNPEDYGLPRTERINEVITQSWNRLRKHWVEFRAATAVMSTTDPATGPTNDKWNLPLLRELGFGPMPTSAGPEIGGRTYAISRFVGPVPVHLVGCGVDLDRRAAGVRGAAAVNPHGLVQEFVNRSPGHLWAIVSNGLRLRVLRDNQALSRQSFLEFDVEAMFAGEVYSDFVLLWLTIHATRFAPRESERPETCWLEEWTQEADRRGARVLGDLRGGVERALQILGEGLTSHPSNAGLRSALRSGEVPLADFHGQLLRVVYRLIFLFVAEDRRLDSQPLLHPRDDSEAARAARQRFAAHYSTGRLRDMASKIKGSRHGDLWRQFQLLVGALSGDEAFAVARETLALPSLGSVLWSLSSTAILNSAELTNYDLLEALRHLAFTRPNRVFRPVNYRNLGAEELGGIYESLLALTPQISSDGARFSFAEFAGNERKTSGSYYTPDSLVQSLLDSALDPLVEEAIKGKTGSEAEQAILALKVCDPAVGSGHFLVGAAHRLARHLARARALARGESEPSPLLYQQALRDVIGRCLYGVDLNPMAAELCRVSLWLEALEPDKPLSFLDHHIRVGNSLLGATPELIGAGLPDDAFTPIEGDDKEACVVLKKRSKAERKGLGPLFALEQAETQARLAKAATDLELMPDNRPQDIRAKELAFRRHEETEEYHHKKGLADAWCAAFVIRKHFTERGRESSARGITQRHLNDLAAGRPMPEDLAGKVADLLRQYKFFHWHLAFPEVFTKGGFDCVLGNPPWEMQEVKDNEFFVSSFPEILAVSSAKDKAAVLKRIEVAEPALWDQYLGYVRTVHCEKHFMLDSGRYPLSAVGRLNLYRLFLEVSHTVINSGGRVGVVVPSGFASDSFSQGHFTALHQTGRIPSLYDFENSGAIFPGVHRGQKFCLITITGASVRAASTDFVFFAHSVDELRDPTRHVPMSDGDLRLLNPLTGTAPLFRSERDRLLTIALHRGRPIVGDQDENGWKIQPILMFMVNAALKHHRTADELSADGLKAIGNRFVGDDDEWLPLYEGKMVGMFDHRAASIRFDPENRVRRNQPEPVSIEEHNEPTRSAFPLFWIAVGEVAERCGGVPRFCVAVKDVTASSNERTSIAAVLPPAALTDSLPWLSNPRGSLENAALAANLNAFAFDYCARQKVAGLHLRGHYLAQLPLIPFESLSGDTPWDAERSFRDWLAGRVLELSYTAWDLALFAADCGWSGPPFRWDEGRRFLLQCELDAALFHVYLCSAADGGWPKAEGDTNENLLLLAAHFPRPRDAVAYIMDSFSIVKRRDEEKYGDYRTKLQILAIYDLMQDAIVASRPYRTILDPPPADPRVAHNDSARPPAPGSAV